MTFMRVAPGEPWVRIEGFATPEELLTEYRQLVAAPLAVGRTLYLQGEAGGVALSARRAGGATFGGAEAACVNCHRRSGYGGSEGRSYIPPIDAGALFSARAPGTGASAAGTGRPAYTDQTLARALRNGIDPAGRRLDYLMPRYEIGDAEMKSLLAYLRGLSTQASTGAEATVVHFATVVAPGVEPQKSKAMTDVLSACFEEHNAGPAPQRGRKRMGPEMSVSQQPQWRLHVWQLQGEPGSWNSQLAEHARRQPVFAMVGGIGQGEWAPVHQFCEAGGMPCVFPHLEAAQAAETGFYSMYLSRGVLLEASLIARHLAEENREVKRVVQVLRAGDEAARAGARALRRILSARGIDTRERHVEPDGLLDAKSVAAAHEEALVLWLRGEELQRLEAIAPVASPVYFSATLSDAERLRLPAAWKAGALMAYPYELPENRAQRVMQLQTWLKARAVALVDEQVQSDAYTACAALRTGMNELAGTPHRDYLIERLEVIMERGGYAGLYPRLALGIGQRFASKTGYLVRFADSADSESNRIVAVGERIAGQ
jgi:hypothetical protein